MTVLFDYIVRSAGPQGLWNQMPRLFILWKGRVELTKDDGLVVYDWSPISILGTWIFVRPGLWFKALKFGMKDNRMRIWSKVTSACLSTCVDALGKFSTLQHVSLLWENRTILTCLYWLTAKRLLAPMRTWDPRALHCQGMYTITWPLQRQWLQ